MGGHSPNHRKTWDLSREHGKRRKDGTFQVFLKVTDAAGGSLCKRIYPFPFNWLHGKHRVFHLVTYLTLETYPAAR
jgi:hypothetical protein